jgi:hypothetical protein
VDDVGPDLADDAGEPPRCGRVVDRRELARQTPEPHDVDPLALGDERHRLLAPTDVPRDERRLVAALSEAARQVRHVERGAADVEASDHPQHTDGTAVRADAHRARD